MFSNIGGKIKKVSKILAMCGIGASIVAGWVMLLFGAVNDAGLAVAGLLVMVLGSLLSWLGAFFSYGFGELVENSAIIADLLAKADFERNGGA